MVFLAMVMTYVVHVNLKSLPMFTQQLSIQKTLMKKVLSILNQMCASFRQTRLPWRVPLNISVFHAMY